MRLSCALAHLPLHESLVRGEMQGKRVHDVWHGMRVLPEHQPTDYLREGRAAVPERWLSCSTMTRKGGYHSRSSRSHCRMTVAGQTMSEGANLREWCRPARNAVTCAWMRHCGIYALVVQGGVL